MPLLSAKMRRYVSCACSSSASDSCSNTSLSDDKHCHHAVTCGPIARRRCRRMLDYDVKAWLEDLSTIADCDLSRSLVDKNNELDDDLTKDEGKGDLNRTLSQLSLTVAIDGRILTSSSNSSRDVTAGCYHNNSDSTGGGGDNLTSSSGYEAGTCWSRDDDVTGDDADDDDVRVSWSDSTGSTRPSVAGLYHLSPVRVAGRAVYVIDSDRLALTSLPVMSPEVVRCVWDEHRRLQRRRRCSPSSSRVESSRIGRLNTNDFERETRDECYLAPSTAELMRRNSHHCVCTRATNGGLRSTENYEEITLTSVEATQIRRGQVFGNAVSHQQSSTFSRRNIETPPVTLRPHHGGQRGHPLQQGLTSDINPAAWYSIYSPGGAQSSNDDNDVTVFLGEELVDWLQRNIPRLSGRPDSVQYAAQLALDGLIYRVHVEDDHGLTNTSERDQSSLFHECCLYAFAPRPSHLHRDNWRC